jgi:hypothetical protein
MILKTPATAAPANPGVYIQFVTIFAYPASQRFTQESYKFGR